MFVLLIYPLILLVTIGSFFLIRRKFSGAVKTYIIFQLALVSLGLLLTMKLALVYIVFFILIAELLFFFRVVTLPRDTTVYFELLWGVLWLLISLTGAALLVRVE